MFFDSMKNVFVTCHVFQGIPSSPVQDSNPPAPAPTSLPTESPASLAEGEACHSFWSQNTCSQLLGPSLLCKEKEHICPILPSTRFHWNPSTNCYVILLIERKMYWPQTITSLAEVMMEWHWLGERSFWPHAPASSHSLSLCLLLLSALAHVLESCSPKQSDQNQHVTEWHQSSQWHIRTENSTSRPALNWRNGITVSSLHVQEGCDRKSGVDCPPDELLWKALGW